jgi:hypothetical protein
VTQERVQSHVPVRWQAAVWVQVGNGMAEPVRTPGEALEKLANRWPMERGRQYQRARANCLAALHRSLDPELARAAFIRASIEAEMLHGAR